MEVDGDCNKDIVNEIYQKVNSKIEILNKAQRTLNLGLPLMRAGDNPLIFFLTMRKSFLKLTFSPNEYANQPQVYCP